jgi:hypothetical protein
VTPRKLMGVASRALYTGAAPLRDEAYRRWIRSYPCTVCGQRFGIEAAHTGPHGIGQKSADSSCLPLCRWHHRELHQGVAAFAKRYELDPQNLVAQFNELWKERKAA